MKKTPCVIVALMFLMTGLALSEEPVHFPDANLKQAVEDNLLVNDPTPSHMLLLVWLDGYEYNITDLTGLEYATNLVSLDLAYNNISDISALSGLNGLFELYLEDNEIVDISALSGLTNLEVLYLNNNNIRDISALSGLRQLFDLDLGYNQISYVSALSELTRLGSLLLDNNLISDISGISDLNWLYFLDLSSNPLNDDAYNIHIPRIIENSPGIEIYYDSQTAARLIVSSANGGSVTRPGEGTFDYNYGDIVVIEATADHGYIFANWAGSAVDNGKVTNPDAASTTVTVDGNYTLRAIFLRPDGGVYFPDPNLQACVEHALGIPNPTQTDMLLLTHLNSRDMPGKIFTDLTGLEYAANLVELDLYGNRISELSALSELTDLTMLDLGSNEIDDITPLAGLTKLTDLFLDDNQIWDISPLSGLTNLRGLDLSFNWIVRTDESGIS